MFPKLYTKAIEKLNHTKGSKSHPTVPSLEIQIFSWFILGSLVNLLVVPSTSKLLIRPFVKLTKYLFWEFQQYLQFTNNLVITLVPVFQRHWLTATYILPFIDQMRDRINTFLIFWKIFVRVLGYMLFTTVISYLVAGVEYSENHSAYYYNKS